MAIFKGQLTYSDIVERIPFRRVVELRNARLQQLKEEQMANERMMEEQNRKMNLANRK